MAYNAADSRRYMDGSIYAGRWSGDQKEREGLGSLTLSSGVTYSGQFCQGKFDGYGVLQFPENAYNSQGPSISNYSGEFKVGKFDGVGILQFSNGAMYEGQFSQGQILGRGKFTLSPGDNVYNSHQSNECEGEYRGGQILNKSQCPDVVNKARHAAEEANRVADQAYEQADNSRL